MLCSTGHMIEVYKFGSEYFKSISKSI